MTLPVFFQINSMIAKTLNTGTFSRTKNSITRGPYVVPLSSFVYQISRKWPYQDYLLLTSSKYNKNERDFAPWSQVHNLATCNLAIWQLGNLATWQFGNLAIWPLGNLAIWQFGNLENWQLSKFQKEILNSPSILATFNFGDLQNWQLL